MPAHHRQRPLSLSLSLLLSLLLLLSLSLLAACARSEAPTPDLFAPTGPAAPTIPAVAGGVATPSLPAAGPIEVTYITPAQQEGPYYPVTKPEDRDHDLVAFAGATGQPAGQVLEFGGRVYDAAGMPVAGAVVEIWQTDATGVYLHPDDPGTAGRDPNFQFYGEAVTGADGSYNFRTIVPGLYEPRPRHIHVKIKLDGEEVLTTQFYFAGEVDLHGDDASLVIWPVAGVDADGTAILTGVRDIVLPIGIGP